MKLLITALFFVLLIILALHPLYASEPPFAPFATCNKGKCTMSEKDYRTYRAWHFALISKMQEVMADNAEKDDEIQGLQRRLTHNAFCEAHRD